ncbi:MAG: MATE family efflux transporter [Acutalibacteraceae bacterium]
MTGIQNLKHNLIGNRNFYRQVLIILVPIIIQNTISNVVSLVDNVMVGRVGTLPMSAVAIVNQLIFVFYLCVFGGLSGAGIFSSQFVGAENKKGIRYAFRMKIYIAFVITTLAILIFVLFPDKLINMYLTKNTSPQDAAETLNYAKGYLWIMLPGLLPFAVSQIYSSTLRELGETKIPMIASVAAIMANVVFNYILIYGNEGLNFLPFAPMGVKGAAIATSLSRYVEMAIVMFVVHSRAKEYDFIIGIYKSLKVPIKLCKDILIKGSPILVNEFTWSVCMALLMQSYSLRGIGVIAATNICSTVANLFNAFYISLGSAIAIMAGQHLGANRIEEAKTTVWRLLALAVASCIFMGVILYSISSVVPNAYNTTNEVRTIASSLLKIVAFMMPFNAFCHGCYFAMRSGGKTIMTLMFDSGFIMLISLPLAFAIANFTDLPIVPFFLAVQAVEAVKAVSAGILIKSGIWIHNIVKDEITV